MGAIRPLVEEALDLARAEGEALAEQDVGRAEELSRKREEILGRILKEATGETELREDLILMRTAQKELLEKAENLRSVLLRQRQDGRRLTVYFDGDRRLKRELRRSVYCDTTS
ncbi:MAG: hypothetical protein LBS65_04850 [Desulfovibrio sp.]|jgi:hypothetical protein|nr:hypothetical protein [Desulfovibrio sp.]